MKFRHAPTIDTPDIMLQRIIIDLELVDVGCKPI